MVRMNKMNKKGEGMITKQTVWAVVAAVVLVSGGYLVYSFFSGTAIPFFDFWPSFNQTKPPVTDYELFGYDLVSGELQYYDGVTWIDFPQDGIEANGKKFDYGEVFSKLTDGFFNSISSANVERAIADGKTAPVINVVFPSGWIAVGDVNYRFNRDKKIWEYDGGSGWGDVQEMGGKYIEESRAFADNLKNKNEEEGYLYIVKTLRVSFPNVNEINGMPFDWFDSFLSNPVTIQTVTTCYQKNSYSVDKALVVDLSEPKGGRECPYLT